MRDVVAARDLQPGDKVWLGPLQQWKEVASTAGESSQAAESLTRVSYRDGWEHVVADWLSFRVERPDHVGRHSSLA